jgi:hypothetical protein
VGWLLRELIEIAKRGSHWPVGRRTLTAHEEVREELLVSLARGRKRKLLEEARAKRVRLKAIDAQRQAARGNRGSSPQYSKPEREYVV